MNGVGVMMAQISYIKAHRGRDLSMGVGDGMHMLTYSSCRELSKVLDNGMYTG